jgi:hypothetical protein
MTRQIDYDCIDKKMFKGSQHNDQKDSMKDLITYLVRAVAHVQEVKLGKLIYIAQLYHYSRFGELLTETRFFSLEYGPHAPLIRSTLKKQLEDNSLYLTESRTSKDPVYSNPCMIIKASEQNDENLSHRCFNTLEEVVEDWGNKPYEHILDYTARTIPHLSTYYRESIDWTSIRPHHGLRYALSLPQKVRIHEFVDEPEKETYQQHNSGKCCPISVNEVAEIYLALCGERPDKIPSPEYLGFNLQAVLYAFDKLKDKNERGSEKSPIEIDKATQLTHSLLNSMSFMSCSSRVALITGMLYLTKSGYSFHRDVLENHWPVGNSQQTLKEWLSRVSVRLDTS